MGFRFDQWHGDAYLAVTMNRRTLITAAVLWPMVGHRPAFAHSARAGEIGIGHAWALPSGASLDGQVFMPLLNKGTTADALVAARCDVAAAVELRRNARYDDAAEARLELLPMKPLAMRPTATHLRLVALRQPLVSGQRFSLILDFLNSGEAEIEVHVEATPGT